MKLNEKKKFKQSKNSTKLSLNIDCTSFMKRRHSKTEGT